MDLPHYGAERIARAVYIIYENDLVLGSGSIVNPLATA